MFVSMIDEKLLAYFEAYLTEKRKATFKNVLEHRTRHFTVVLEDIYQPHNASAVVRTCDIFGVQDVHSIENKCLDALKEKGYQLIATSPHYDSCLLQDFDINKKTAFILGAEAEGVSDIVKSQADGFLKIPMVGFTESLNISVAAAIILQSVTTKLRSSKIDWQLSTKEKEILYFDWVKKTIKNVDKIEERYFANLKT